MDDKDSGPDSEETLRFLGILRSLKGFPGQLAVALFSIAMVGCLYQSLNISATSIAASNHQLIVAVVGALVAVVAYTAGNFWDRVVFNRLYGPQGTRLDKVASTFFPSGVDLKRARNDAINVVQPPGTDGVGIYRDCKDIARKDKASWDWIEEPVVLSKIARSFIWPCVLVIIGCALAGFAGPVIGWRVELIPLVSIALVSACFAILLFIPYLEYRVEHMIRLYRTAFQMRS